MTVKPEPEPKRRVKRWSARVTQKSDALDLESEVFKKKSANEIAQSLKRSAEESERRKSSPYRSAMSMLTFYINRAGENLSVSRLRILESAKNQLRKLYKRPTTSQKVTPGTAKKRTAMKKHK
ncbi:MAG: DUF3175 domain-containing protein [Pseudomonadota bacterium]|nr:DUF3175 domain-containing protein [Pseudomonadota bacterium]